MSFRLPRNEFKRIFHEILQSSDILHEEGKQANSMFTRKRVTIANVEFSLSFFNKFQSNSKQDTITKFLEKCYFRHLSSQARFIQKGKILLSLHFISSHLILSYLILSYLILSHPISSYLISSYRIFSHLKAWLILYTIWIILWNVNVYFSIYLTSFIH